jgi:hypothetical protein
MSQPKWSREFFGKFSKKFSHLEEESYEIVEIFEEFGQISSFLVFESPYLTNKFLAICQHVIGFLDFLLLYFS